MTWYNFLLHLGVALLLGGVIGLERQYHLHVAGLRTNTLVALGAAIFVSLGSLVGMQDGPAHIAPQVVSGLGFLGAGVILHEGLNVRGLNTAATIWCSGGVGTLAGGGYLAEAALAAGCVLAVNVVLRPVVMRMELRANTATNVELYYRIRVTTRAAEEAVIRNVLLRHIGSQPRVALHGLSSQAGESKDSVHVVADIYAAERNDHFMEETVARIGCEPGVTAASWERVTR
jgi:putative Mg2+ transporter-C (MgtC) family protein